VQPDQGFTVNAKDFDDKTCICGGGGLWMKLHERSEYEIDLALRLSLIKIHFN
jgi:hypothetical protein